MQQLLVLLIASLLLTGCNFQSLEDFREEGTQLSKALIQELHAIRTYEELKAARPILKDRFKALVEVMIAAQEYREKYPTAEMKELTLEHHAVSDQLRQELNRLYQIEGGREVIEQCQQDALDRLDAYEKQRLKHHHLLEALAL